MSSVCPHLGDGWIHLVRDLQHLPSTVSVLDVGGKPQDGEDQADLLSDPGGTAATGQSGIALLVPPAKSLGRLLGRCATASRGRN